MRKLIQLVCFVSLVCLACSSIQAEEKLATMSYDQIITSSGGATMTSKVWIKGNNMRTEQTMEGEKMVTLMKEGAMYLYYPAQKMAMKMDIGAGTGQGGKNPKNMMEYLKSVKAKPLGQERIEGKLCDVYQITYPQKGLPVENLAKVGAKNKVWIWRKKKFPLRSVMTVGNETMTTRYRNIQMDINIPNNYFELPPGTQMMDMSQMIPGIK